MHKHRQSVRGKVKKEFIVKDGTRSYYNIKLNKHIIANYVSDKPIDMLVEGYNAMVEKNQKKPNAMPSFKKFGFQVV